MRLMVVGDRAWKDVIPVERWLTNSLRKYPSLEILTDGTQVGLLASMWAIKNKTVLHKYPDRLQVWPEELQPDVLLVFHNFVEGSTMSRRMVEQARQHGIPDVLINRNGEQYQWPLPD